jgi:hypothetical protein
MLRTMIDSKEVRTVVWHSAKSNIFNVGVALAIERIAKRMFYSVPGTEESIYIAGSSRRACFTCF